jgi:hypothetical protein
LANSSIVFSEDVETSIAAWQVVEHFSAASAIENQASCSAACSFI